MTQDDKTPEDDNQDPLESIEKLHLPEVEKRAIIRMFGHQQTRVVSPFAEKVSSEHISKLIDIEASKANNEAKARTSFYVFIVLVIVILCVFILALLQYNNPQNKELIEKIIVALLSFLGGLGLGNFLKKPQS